VRILGLFSPNSSGPKPARMNTLPGEAAFSSAVAPFPRKKNARRKPPFFSSFLPAASSWTGAAPAGVGPGPEGFRARALPADFSYPFFPPFLSRCAARRWRFDSSRDTPVRDSPPFRRVLSFPLSPRRQFRQTWADTHRRSRPGFRLLSSPLLGYCRGGEGNDRCIAMRVIMAPNYLGISILSVSRSCSRSH